MSAPLLENPSLLFTDVDGTEAAMADLRNESTETNYVVLGYKGNDKKVSLLHKGSGGIEEIHQYCGEKDLLFILIGYIIQEEKFSTLKYVFISWIGPRARPMAKARSTQHRVAVYNFVSSPFLQLQAEMQVFDIASMTEDAILEKITGSKLHRKPVKRTHTVQKSLQKGTEEYKIANQADFDAALKTLRDDKSDVNYVLAGYQEDRQAIHFLESGSGGYEAFEAKIADDKVSYCVLGLNMEEAGGVRTQVRYIFVTFIGEKVPASHKARSSQHRVKLYVHINDFLQPHGEFSALSRQELTLDALYAKLIGKNQQNVKAPSAPKAKATNTLAPENIGKTGSPYQFRAKKPKNFKLR